MPIRRAPANLETLCREVISDQRAAHPQKDFQLALAGDLAGEWDSDCLRQLLGNLLGNAVQHGGDGPVRLSVNELQAGVRIEVQNAGAPIPAEAIETIFEPMVRLSQRETSHPTGSVGLGLYICREIAQAHGGSIRVASSAERGTIFTVDLPRASPVEAPSKS